MVAEPEERDYLADFWKFVDANLPEAPYNRPKEVQRIGASRSQDYGTYKIIQWKPIR
jgi:hypothetical protein